MYEAARAVDMSRPMNSGLVASLFPQSTDRRWWSLWTIGALARAALIIFALPLIYSQWFLPFLQYWGSNPELDPWTSFLEAGGIPEAFPYGLPYIVAFAPPVAIGTWLGDMSGGALALGLSVALLDLLLAGVIARIASPKHAQSAYLFYWLNPITIYVCYWHGQLDVLPVLLIAISLLATYRTRILLAGLALGLAISAKFAMALALPFFLVMFVRERRYNDRLPALAAGISLGLIPIAVSVFSPGFRDMVLGTPEAAKIFAATILVTEDHVVYVLPVALAALLLASWRIGRFTPKLLLVQVGLGFLFLYLLTPASPGWTLWLIPFLAVLAPAHGRVSLAITGTFLMLTLLYHLNGATGALILGEPVVWPFTVPDAWTGPLEIGSALLSGIVATGTLIIAQTVRYDIFRDPFFQGSRSPIAIAIAGDSGTGKDTLAAAVGDMFGRRRLAHVSGDDYHIWDRNKPMWLTLTHLNPQANHLKVYFRDVQSLLSGSTIIKRHYDHAVGRMTRPYAQKSRELVIASGLHALHNQALNDELDLRIYLDMDEALRRALKIRRDVTVRGHPLATVEASIERRSLDAERFIAPQRAAADIIFSLLASSDSDLEALRAGELEAGEVRMRMRVGLRENEHSLALQDQLIAAVGAKVSPFGSDDDFHWIEIETNVPARAIAFGTRVIAPGIFDFLSLEPKWRDGLPGVMQLIVLDFLSRRRRIDRN